MKHDALIAPDESQFAFTPKFSGFTANDGSTDTITVPDAELLFQGTFKRDGDDLKIIGKDGNAFLIDDYFKSEKKPTLLSPEGASLSSAVIESLAGPLAPGQYAQAGAQQGTGQAIGRVEKAEGNVSVVRNGVTITLNAGDVVMKGDVVQTGAGGSLGIVFSDGTAFNLAANARMVLNDFVYNTGGGGNSALISLVQGSISFVAGQVAKTGDLRVETPVATMGIRGTAVLVEIEASNGQTKFSVMMEPDGTTGSFNLYDKSSGALIATVNSSNIGWVVTPAGPLQVIAQQVQKTPAELARELAIVQQVFQTFNTGPFDPNAPQQQPPQQDPGRRGDNPQGTQTAGGGSSGGVLIDPVKLSGTQTPTGNSQTSNNQNNNTGNPNDTGTDGSGPGDDTPSGGETETVTLSANNIFGTTGNDTIVGTEINDFVFAGAGDDTIIAGQGGGNDFYDGDGDGGKTPGFAGEGVDTIKFESANGITFDLFGIAELNKAFSASTGLDDFINIERIVASPGDDVFNLHSGGWHIEAGEGDDVFYLYTTAFSDLDGGNGIDIIRLDGDLDINGNTEGPDVKNIEIIDLRNNGQNTIGFEGGGLEESDNKTIRILGEQGDIVNLADHFGDETGGHWVLTSETTMLDPFSDDYSNGTYFYEYQFVDGEQILATAYIDEAILVEEENDAPVANDVTLRTNALGNGGFDATPDFDGWTVDLGTFGTSSANFSTAGIDRSGEIIEGDTAVAVLSFSAWVPEPGDTGFGPSVTGDAFFGYEGDTIRFVWQLSSGDDWATGYGYIVDADSGEIVQVIFDYQAPFTGSTGVQATDITLESGGEFEIVFRVGSYDWTHGQLIGAELDLGYAGVLHTGVSENLSVTFAEGDLLANSTDSDDDDLTLTAVSVTSALGAVVVLNANGSVTYDPTTAVNIQSLAAGETATDTFTFTISDGNGHFDTATATLAVLGVNDAPAVDSHNTEVCYTLDDPGTSATSDITLSDVDSGTLKGAKITISNFVESDTLIFANAGNISGTFDPETGVLTLTGEDTIGNYQFALRSVSYQNNDPEAPTGDRTITFQVDDGAESNHASNVATSTIHVDDDSGGEETPNKAPVISIDNASTTDEVDSTTVLGLSVSDADETPGDQYTVTASALHGTLSGSEGNPEPAIDFHGALEGVNNMLAQGITYIDPAESEPGATVNEKVTLTVSDANGGSDTINFIFNLFGTGPEIILSGTEGKDILFSTGYDDTLTGDPQIQPGPGSADAFVFSFDEFQIGNDRITDFDVSQDRIVFDGGEHSAFAQLQIDYDDELHTATIDLGQDGMVILNGVARDSLKAGNFVFHPDLT